MIEIRIPKKGAIIELKIESLAFGGMGIAHIGELIVFVKHAIPGQTVLARILKKRKSYLEAIRLEIVQESPFAVEYPCEHVQYCGGCTFQNLEYSHQLQAKENQVKEVFQHLGGFENIDIAPILACEKTFHYRNKMEFTYSNRPWFIPGNREGELKDFALGLHVPKRFDKILSIEKCYLQIPLANQILKTVKDLSIQLNLTPYDIKMHQGFMRNVIIRTAEMTGEIMVNLVTAYEQTELIQPIVDALKTNFPEVASIVNNITSRKAGVSAGEFEHVLHGSKYIVEKLGDYEFEISANSFFQTNTSQAKRLYDIVLDECNLNSSEIVYDLFCGTGSISIYLSALAKKVYGFELVYSAILDAKRNAKRNKADNVSFFEGDLMRILREQDVSDQIETPDVVVVDPPRAGLHPKTVQDILRLNPDKIIYVSCNPSTQARDIQILCTENYSLIRLHPVDMFPHTPHVENVATLVCS